MVKKLGFYSKPEEEDEEEEETCAFRSPSFTLWNATLTP